MLFGAWLIMSAVCSPWCVYGATCFSKGTNRACIVDCTSFSSCLSHLFHPDVDFRQYMKDPIHDNQPPVNLRRDKKREKCGTGNEKVTKRHAISLTEPSLGLSLSASGMSNDGISIADDSVDKMMIRLDADGVVSDGNRPRGSQRSGSDASMHNYGSYMKSFPVSNCDRIRISDLNAELPLSSQCLVGLNGPVKRTITPPPKVALPRGMHSDVYDTVFALQSLGDGWPEYLNRVRTLWDTHMHQHGTGVDANNVSKSQTVNTSSSPDETQSGDKIGVGKGNRSCTPPSEKPVIIQAAQNDSGKHCFKKNNGDVKWRATKNGDCSEESNGM